MLDCSETLENVYLAFNQHIGLKNKRFENLVRLTFKMARKVTKLPVYKQGITCLKSPLKKLESYMFTNRAQNKLEINSNLPAKHLSHTLSAGKKSTKSCPQSYRFRSRAQRCQQQTSVKSLAKQPGCPLSAEQNRTVRQAGQNAGDLEELNLKLPACKATKLHVISRA